MKHKSVKRPEPNFEPEKPDDLQLEVDGRQLSSVEFNFVEPGVSLGGAGSRFGSCARAEFRWDPRLPKLARQLCPPVVVVLQCQAKLSSMSTPLTPLKRARAFARASSLSRSTSIQASAAQGVRRLGLEGAGHTASVIRCSSCSVWLAVL